MVLRPHHLLCIQKYTGHGYDAAFTAYMTALCEKLRMAPETPVTTAVGADDLCAVCPHCTGGICDAQEKVTALDAAVQQYCALPETPQPWNVLAETAAKKILHTALFDSICFGCQWYELCKTTGGITNGTEKAEEPHA